MKTKQTFEEYLRKGNLSENTITSYLCEDSCQNCTTVPVNGYRNS